VRQLTAQQCPVISWPCSSTLFLSALVDLTSIISRNYVQSSLTSVVALPDARVRFAARLVCQGRALRSRERKLRGLDSACGKAPGTATKGICFFFSGGNHARKKERGNQMPERQHPTWGELLREAVEKRGRMLQAYTAFHNYSFLCLPQHRSENVDCPAMLIGTEKTRRDASVLNLELT